jgi:hypothetical protein
MALTFQFWTPILTLAGRLAKAMAGETEKNYAELRRTRRVKVAKPLRVRPSEAQDEHFEDFPISVNASKEGIYFTTRRAVYRKGMRVFVTFPYTRAHDPMSSEYLAEVSRVENLPHGRFGIAVHLLMSV